MNHKRLTTICLMSTVLIGTVGCASTATAPANAGKPMSVEAISQQYKQGTELVAKGEDIRRKAQEKIKAAQAMQQEGDSMISRGKTLMAESEQAFRDASKSKGSE